MSIKKEFGDFQTPLSLARRVVEFLKLHETDVGSILEPTCGVGAFLRAAAEGFGKRPLYWGFDVNGAYVNVARSALEQINVPNLTIEQRDFYKTNWEEFFSKQPAPTLVIGNPPWITNAGMGVLKGSNLPVKNNSHGLSGLDAKTGKANFDISEWMVVRLLNAMRRTRGAVAVLCKTATARKVLFHVWSNKLDIGPSSMHLIDATAEFGVSVDACLLYIHTGMGVNEQKATVYDSLSYDSPLRTFGLLNGELVSDIDSYALLSDLDGSDSRKWRSGVKHDAAQVMEFTCVDGQLFNGFDERCQIEDDFLYPLLKSSDLANGRLRPTRFVLLTQRRVGDPTDLIKKIAPKTWRYLLDHADQLDSRGSSIYLNRARFSIFGVGDYSFSPAKVAISGLYKKLVFQPVGSAGGKPIMLDDTCYFIPCESKQEAKFFADLLNSETALQFMSSLVFTDAKRPVTTDVLKRMNLKRLAERAGLNVESIQYFSTSELNSKRQGVLFS